MHILETLVISGSHPLQIPIKRKYRRAGENLTPAHLNTHCRLSPGQNVFIAYDGNAQKT